MPNKYDKEVEKAQEERDNLILAEIVLIYNAIREISHKEAMRVVNKAGDNKQFFTPVGKQETFAKQLNKKLRPEYLKRDSFIKKVYAEEYRTSYFMSKYAVENQGIAKGYRFTLPRYTKKQFREALDYPLSKLINTAKMQTGRTIDINQVFNSIVSGVQQGQSLPKINNQIDIDLGYRDSSGKWVADKTLRKGQQYKTQRVLRSEIGRIRSDAKTDQWINQQDTVKSELQNVETRDNRTRSQSVSMDLQIADKNGEFLFPNGTSARMRKSGVAAYDINDRQTLITLDPEYKPTQRIARNPKTGENKITPYTNAEQWAKDQNPPLKRNKYGELLF